MVTATAPYCEPSLAEDLSVGDDRDLATAGCPKSRNVTERRGWWQKIFGLVALIGSPGQRYKVPVWRSALVVLAVLLTACEGARVVLPTESTGPAEILDAYLRAFQAGDCQSGRQFVTDTFNKGGGELCGETRLQSHSIVANPARPSNHEVEYATSLVVTGTADGSVPAGELTWFYDIVQQANGAWRIVGGGSGP